MHVADPGGPGQGTNPARREGIPLGRIAGVPVVLAYSWFVIAAFTVIVYGPVLARNNPTLGTSAYIVAFAYAVLLLISVLVHELAHALTAKIYGWPTQKIVLNLWGGHTQFESFTSSPGRSVLVALAGPAANFVLAGGAWLLLGTDSLGSVAEILTNIFMWANFLMASSTSCRACHWTAAGWSSPSSGRPPAARRKELLQPGGAGASSSWPLRTGSSFARTWPEIVRTSASS